MQDLTSDVSFSKIKTYREQRLAAFMDHHDLDVLIGLSGGARGQRGVVRFLANYATTSQSSCVLWARNESPRLVVPYSVHQYWAEDMSWIEDIQVNADYPAAIADYLREYQLTQGKLGWAGIPFLVDAVKSDFETVLHTESHSVSDAFTKMRATNCEEELKLVHRCGAIADEVFRQVADKVRPGIFKLDIVAEAEYVARRLGSEGASILIGTGNRLPGPMPQNRQLRQGDVFQLSVEPEGPGGFWVQTVRMFVLGEPGEQLTQSVEQGLEAESQAESLMQDKRPVVDVAEAMLEILGQDESSLVAPLGHGIGLDNSVPPRISKKSSEVLQTDMTIVIHPTDYSQSIGMFLGDTFIVRETRAEKVSDLSSGLIVV